MCIGTDFDRIKDFNDRFISQEIELPADFPKPFSQTERIMHLSKIRGVFSPEEGKEAQEALRCSPKLGPAVKFKRGLRNFYISENIFPFAVHFDQTGKVDKKSISSSIYKSQEPIIQRIMIAAMERLATELQWKDTTHHLACNAVDYFFSNDSEEPLDWHCDGYESQVKHSFVVLLSDPADEETGWIGGDLLYTAARAFQYSKDFQERQKFYEQKESSKGLILNEPKSPIWQISPNLNDAILFGNQGMQHKITALYPKKRIGNRMILTVFDYGTTAEFEQGKEQQRQML